MYSNIPGSIVEKLVLPPLESASGVASDYRCIHAAAKFELVRGYHWDVNMMRLRTNGCNDLQVGQKVLGLL